MCINVLLYQCVVCVCVCVCVAMSHVGDVPPPVLCGRDRLLENPSCGAVHYFLCFPPPVLEVKISRPMGNYKNYIWPDIDLTVPL